VNRALSIFIWGLSPFVSVACVVPQGRYDEATAKLHAEQAARTSAEGALATAQAELAHLDDALRGKEKSLDGQGQELAEAKLDVDRAATERDDAVVLVEQLRGDLARVADNLREYSQQKTDLEASLAEADARAKKLDAAERLMAARVGVMRDVATAYGDPALSDKVFVSANAGNPVVRFSAGEVFVKGQEGADEVRPEAAALFARLATTLASRPDARVSLADLASPSIAAEDRIIRLQLVADVLVKNGVTMDRISFASADSDGTSPKVTEPVAADAPSATEPRAAKPAANGAFKDGAGSVELVVDVARPYRDLPVASLDPKH
jgi:hypothetical protein